MSNRSSSSVRGTQVAWWCMAIALILHVSSGSPANRSPELLSRHHLAKRSFFDLQCRGVYDKSIFARLDRICVDCYNLFREPSVHSLCRSQCFSTKIFKGCVESLLEMEEWSKLKKMIDFVGK
ncbi:ion transport peptide isoform X2 [Leptinotarsa decemlineata]|uniref:ion transport peptide isoform X2 n=1 Tax=Leptinotarsa decemlineata TaxID=7539 RepID=UPI003D305FD0